ncbi:hypothetical protein D9M68_752800 [compost metagenome]
MCIIVPVSGTTDPVAWAARDRGNVPAGVTTRIGTGHGYRRYSGSRHILQVYVRHTDHGSRIELEATGSGTTDFQQTGTRSRLCEEIFIDGTGTGNLVRTRTCKQQGINDVATAFNSTRTLKLQAADSIETVNIGTGSSIGTGKS